MDTGERRLVATMPLHAITSAYGEEGLRVRFAAEIETWPEADQRRLNQALALAGRLHAADRRDREPYVNHLLRVAIRIMSHYGVGLIHTTGPRLHRLAGKYAPLVPVLQELIELPDTPLDAPVRQRILTQLGQAADRFAAILPAGDHWDR